MEEVALGQFFFRDCHFAVLHIHFHVNSTIIVRISGQYLGIFKQSGVVQILESIHKEVLYIMIVGFFFIFYSPR